MYELNAHECNQQIIIISWEPWTFLKKQSFRVDYITVRKYDKGNRCNVDGKFVQINEMILYLL